jgi:hypothetical protein
MGTRPHVFRFGRLFKLHVIVGVWMMIAAYSIPAAAAPQQIIENPKTPPAANAGRIIPLEEVARIVEEPGKFFFVQPLAVFTGVDGSVYVQEYKQFLKFDPQGRFVKNLLKRGQGPGELSDNLTDVIVRRDDILFYSSNSLKFIRIDPDGRLLDERRFAETPYSSFLGLRGGRYIFLKYERGEFPRVNGIYETNRRVVIVPDDGQPIETPHLMAMTDARQFRRGSVSILSISRLTATWVGDRDVFLFHSPDYLIKHLDLETGEIDEVFRREYERVKYETRIPKGYPEELVPKYHNDLCRLLWRNDRLWAVTSTFDPNKGILVDVFSRDGKYLDNFYLSLFGIRRNNPQYYAPMATHGDFLYVLEAGEDDIVSLVKYRIGGE